MKAPRVLLVTHEASLSGAPRVALLVARLLAERGHRVTTLSRRPGELAEEFRAVGRFRVEPMYRLRARLGRTRGLRWLMLLVETGLAAWSILVRRPQLVYLNSTASIAYLRPALWLRRRVVVHSHESTAVALPFLTPHRAVPLLTRADLVACSPSVRLSLAELASRPMAEVVLLPSVPDADRVRELAAAPPEREYPDNTVVIGCCATVEHRKGADLWPAVIGSVRAALPDTRLRFVWIGSLDDPVLAAADPEVFVGPATNPYSEMARFDIAVLPSRDDPFPLVVLEAMLLEKPVVAFAVGGVPEQIGDTGILVPPEDVEALAQAVIALVVDPQRRRDLGRAAGDRARNHYSPSAFAGILATVITPPTVIRPTMTRTEQITSETITPEQITPAADPPPIGAESIAVVVVTYHSAQHIRGFLGALTTGLAGLDWHLVVVDNASADDTVATVRRLAPLATLVETGRNAGYAAGINAGVAAAGPHSAVLVLNPDVRLRPGCVGELLTVLRRPGTGLAVPHLIDGEGELIETMRREPTVLRALGDAFLGARRAGLLPLLGEVVTERRRYSEPAVVDWAEGSTILISAECWQRCGPWDESFFLYSEETDFALRARDAGLATRYVPTAEAVHLEGDSRESPGLWTLLTLNRVRLFRRRRGLVAATGFWAALVLREGSRAALGRPTNQAALRALLSPRRLRETPGPEVVHGSS